MKRMMWRAAALAICAAWPGSQASAEDTLIFATTNTPQAEVTKEIYDPWTAEVNQKGEGILKIDQRNDVLIANSRNFYDRVKNDVVQIVFGAPNFVPGKFRNATLTTLPFVAGSGEETAVAYWRLLQTGLLDNEMSDLHPLWVSSYPGVALHFREPPKELKSLAGAKIIVSGRVLGDIVERLGGSPVSLTMHEMYTALQRGTVDGAGWPFAGLVDRKFDEVTTYHVREGLGSAPAMVFMMKKRFDALPRKAQQLLTETTGEALSRKVGQMYDRLDKTIASELAANPKHKVVTLNPEQLKAWRAAAAPVIAEWENEDPKGREVLAGFRGILAQVQAGK